MRKTGPEIKAEKRRRILRCAFVVLLASGLTLLGVAGVFYSGASLYQRYLSRRFQAEQSPARVPDAASEHQKKVGSSSSHREVQPISPGETVARLEIPRLGISVMVLEGVDAATLQRGVGHIPGTSLPGPAGNVALAGHRDTFFRPLKEVKPGDAVQLTTPQGRFEYTVESTEVVEPDRTDVLDAAGGATLTLVTCYPFYLVGHAPERFVVRARQVASARPEAALP